MDYKFSHINDYAIAIGAPVKILSGQYKDRKGYVSNVFTSIITNRPFHAFEITLYTTKEDDNYKTLLMSDRFDAPFAIDVTLKEGNKYVTMSGDVVTMYAYNAGTQFLAKYSEITGDPNNTSSEYYTANGFANHYDCGMNILKEYVEPKGNIISKNKILKDKKQTKENHMTTETNGKETVEIFSNCMDCPMHLVEPDPDPNDWFNDDDELVLCKEVNRNVTIACRPYHKRAECKVPDWCPRLKSKIDML